MKKILKGELVLLRDGSYVRATEDTRRHKRPLAKDRHMGPVEGFRNGDDLIVKTADGTGYEVYSRHI